MLGSKLANRQQNRAAGLIAGRSGAACACTNRYSCYNKIAVRTGVGASFALPQRDFHTPAIRRKLKLVFSGQPPDRRQHDVTRSIDRLLDRGDRLPTVTAQQPPYVARNMSNLDARKTAGSTRCR